MPNAHEPPVLRLGTRNSALALVQARHIARLLRRTHRVRGLRVELVELTSSGDRDRTSPLKTFGGAGVFVKELEMALLDGRVDLAVHSLKDLPTTLPRGLLLAAVPEREDVRDALVLRPGASQSVLDSSGVLGSGSPRRRAQLACWFPGVRFEEIRGNVETRVRKVSAGRYAGTVLALAGLKRLAGTHGAWKIERGALIFRKGHLPKPGPRRLRLEILPVERVLPAPGQGALGLECRARDARTRRLLAALDVPSVHACVRAERACLAALGGGCHLPLGAFASVDAKGKLKLRAVLALPNGRAAARAEAQGTLRSPEALGRAVADKIKASPEGRRILKVLARSD